MNITFYHLTTPRNALSILEHGIKVQDPHYFAHMAGVYLIGISESIGRVLSRSIINYVAESLHFNRYFVVLKVLVEQDKCQIYKNYFKDNELTNTYIYKNDILPESVMLYDVFEIKKKRNGLFSYFLGQFTSIFWL